MENPCLNGLVAKPAYPPIFYRIMKICNPDALRADNCSVYLLILSFETNRMIIGFVAIFQMKELARFFIRIV